MDITNILQHLFKKPALEEVSLASLQEMVEKYPYFAPGHFLLAKKLKLEKESASEEQVQKTNLYFPNTLWLHHNLENSKPAPVNISDHSYDAIISEQLNGKVFTETVDETANEITPVTGVSTHEEMPRPGEMETISATRVSSDEHLREEIFVEPNRPNEGFSVEESFVDEHFIKERPVEDSTAEEHIEELTAHELYTQKSLNEPSADKQYAKELSNEEALHETSYVDESSIEESLNETAYANESTIEEPLDKTSYFNESSIEEPLHEKSHDSSIEESLHEPSFADEPSVEDSSAKKPAIADASRLETEILNSKEAKESIQETATAAKPVVQMLPGKPAFAKGELDFDPYHTIDYFASLGIRLSQDPRPDDKLGQQLKSFTAWLKTMRRLPEASGTETVEVNQADLNAHIEKIAAHSLVDREVITQAMAEVLVKQGNKEKATEIYHKLSLLNPGKSAYFAAKIEELKRY